VLRVLLMTATTTARFWIFENDSFVRLSLRDGESLRWATGGRTDEGYRWAGCTWSREGSHITLQWGSEERDCDGRFDRSGELETTTLELTARAAYGDETGLIRLPEWHDVDSRQRDHTAEAAGY